MSRAIGVLLNYAFAGVAALFAASNVQSGSQDDTNLFVSCRVAGSAVVVDLGATHRTAFAGVVTPQDKLLHLVNPTLEVDMLGERYDRQEFSLSIANEVGATQDGDRVRIFDVPGEYRIVFRDANTVAGEALRAFSCRVTLPGRAVAPPAKRLSG